MVEMELAGGAVIVDRLGEWAGRLVEVAVGSGRMAPAVILAPGIVADGYRREPTVAVEV